ncbi:hypothetical protein ACA910_003823 [Epithemia clementina (nom. ined.)]
MASHQQFQKHQSQYDKMDIDEFASSASAVVEIDFHDSVAPTISSEHKDDDMNILFESDDGVVVDREAVMRSIDDEKEEESWNSDDVGFTQDTFDFTMVDDEETRTSQVKDRALMARPFDVHLLQESIAQGSKILEHLEGKNVVLVVGKTGAGKSTLIQALAGKQIYTTQHRSRASGETMDKTVFEANDALEGFAIGHGKVSKTQHLNFHKIRSTITTTRRRKSEGGVVDSTGTHTTELVLVDSPGYQDTEGHEIDIATSVMLSQVAKHARCLRFVILINYISLLEDRGGAVKGILKLVRTFVRDFDASKLSFVFLFTHTNEIASITPRNSLPAAREALRKEILWSLESTAKDPELWQVLNYMNVSLGRNFPMVDVFHPILSNVASLKSTIHSLQPVPGDHLAANCGLTQTSKLKLTGELHKLYQKVRSSLEPESPNLDHARKILNTLRQLETSVDVHEVRLITSEVVDFFRGFINHCDKVLEIELQRGTSGELEFGLANVETVNRSLWYLTALKNDLPEYVDTDRVIARLHGGLRKFCKCIKTESETDLSQIQNHFKKFLAWRECQAELGWYFVDFMQHVSGLVSTAVEYVEAFRKPSQIESESLEWMKLVFEKAYYLTPVANGAELLSSHLDVFRVVKAVTRAQHNLSAALKHFNQTALSEEDIKKASQRQDDPDFLVRPAKAVEFVGTCLGSVNIFPSLRLREMVEGNRRRLLNAGTIFIEEACSAAQSVDDSDVETKKTWLLFLFKTAQAYLNVGCKRWSDMVAPCQSIIEKHKCLLQTKQGELSSLVQMALNQGITNGQRDCDALKFFAASHFFDELLPMQDRFIVNCFETCERAYERRSSIVMDLLDDGILSLKRRKGNPLEILRSVGSLILEQKELDIVARAFDSKNFMKSKVAETKLKNFIQGLKARTKNTCSRWLAAVQQGSDDVLSLTEDLCMSLSQVELLDQFDLDCKHVLTSIKSEIQIVGKTFAEKVQMTISSDKAPYDEKLKYLASYSILAGAGANMTRFLPLEYDLLKQHALAAVRCHADRVEVKLLESSNWEVVEAALDDLEQAKKLDEYTSSEGSTRVRSLRALLEQKQTAVDDVVEKMIAARDYKGLREFLLPSAGTKDQIRKQRFDSCMARVVESLSFDAEEVNRLLQFKFPTDEDLGTIANSIRALQGANTNLKRCLDLAEGKLSLDATLTKSKLIVNARMAEYANKMQVAAKTLDFATLGTNQIYANQWERHLKAFFSTKTEQAYQRASRDFREAVDSVVRAVKDFVDCWFVPKTLSPLLWSLKSASEQKAPELPLIVTVYHDAKETLNRLIQSALLLLKDHVLEKCCFDDAIRVLDDLEASIKGGLGEHITSVGMISEINLQRDEWEDARLEVDRTHFPNDISNHVVLSWKKRLNSLDPNTWKGAWNSFVRGGSSSFHEFEGKITARVNEKIFFGEAAMQSRNYSAVQQAIEILEMMECHLKKYIPIVRGASARMQNSAHELYRDLCARAKNVLLSGSRKREFQDIYENYRQLVVAIPSVVLDADDGHAFRFTNQLVYESLCKDIDALHEWKESFDFQLLGKRITELRVFGDFIADYATLLHEEAKTSKLGKDEWLLKTFQLCQEHFSCDRDLGRIHQYAILGLRPSASMHDIQKAYRDKAKKTHPDKKGAGNSSDEGAEFRRINEAYESLLATSLDRKTGDQQPFDSLLMDLHIELKKEVKGFLKDQQYSELEKVLFHLGELHLLDHLASPPLHSAQTIADVVDIIKGHVERVKVEIGSNWTERKYQALNGNLSDLKMMEEKFKGYPNIFPPYWNKDISEMIEKEIVSLGQQARNHISDQATAKSREQDFRRCFIDMGKVFVDLAPFKEFTKARMSEVLETCLAYDWGYSYLFDFGLKLQRNDEEVAEDENLVAQMLLSEFSHFKEVLTMVWNEETSQKPVEDTVRDIHGVIRRHGAEKQAPLDTGLLLSSFRDFEGEYKSLLGDYLHPGADIMALINKIMTTANELKPCSCDCNWGGKMKAKVPKILAGIFAVFTVLKSGESYRRVENSRCGDVDGAKILMKPHNIQVLTLLCMFGCGSSSIDSLESQLMQIRTGEGKSIILGAAAVFLGLLGFRVRCVCYSEYLSIRDYNLFSEVFEAFQLTKQVKYSKITTLSEDTTYAKGNIRLLTEKLLHGRLEKPGSNTPPQHHMAYNRKGELQIKPSESSSAILSDGLDNGCAYNTDSCAHYDVRKKIVNTKTDSSLRVPRTLPEQPQPEERQKEPQQVETGGSVVPIQTEAARQCDKIKTTHKPHVEKKTSDGGLVARKLEEPMCPRKVKATGSEILLVDEVDVFFGPDFYGQTYNQVTQIYDPVVEGILRQIWEGFKSGGRRLRLADIQGTHQYQTLVRKVPGFEFLVDSEITAMLNEVRLVEEEPYYVDKQSGRIGYKVMDSVSFEATYGYRTVFAYMKEADEGNLLTKDIAKSMAMQVSCGRFSYANISPARVLGVSGTLAAMGDYEKEVLAKYGLEKYLFIPSVYGQSNFSFDKAGSGVQVEKGKSDYFHSITDKIVQERKQKRAVIVFFPDKDRLDEYAKSAFYRKLERPNNIALLKEDMLAADKEFVISKAATSGQVTFCTAAFGRGTDFFCKDDRVQLAGGVHVIQCFFSEQVSEEIQIQGRTARQGKKGTYQMILLESDLLEKFGIREGLVATVAKEELYAFLDEARSRRRDQHCRVVETNLTEATLTDSETHKYFDAVLSGDAKLGSRLFRDLYRSFTKKRMPSELSIDIAFAVDQTGSMAPFTKSTKDTVTTLLDGPNSITKRLQGEFPEITFVVRAAVMAFRDVDDKNDQFHESILSQGSHFTRDTSAALEALHQSLNNPFGGADIAEDHLGAIQHCSTWTSPSDWTSHVKFLMLFTDAPAHGMVPAAYIGTPNADRYDVLHPKGLTPKDVSKSLIDRGIDLVFCSFNPHATQKTESELSKQLLNLPENTARRELTSIPMVDPNKKPAGNALTDGNRKHVVFVLDESGSMQYNWPGVVQAYNNYLGRRRQSQSGSDLVTVVQFDSSARTMVRLVELSQAPTSLGYRGGGTQFYPAANEAEGLVRATPSTHVPIVVFMSDGGTNDALAAAATFSNVNSFVQSNFGYDLELHVIAFGCGADAIQLQQIANASPRGRVHASANTAELSTIFVNIAGGQDVAQVLQAEVAKRISEAVADRLAIEYLGS